MVRAHRAGAAVAARPAAHIHSRVVDGATIGRHRVSRLLSERLAEPAANAASRTAHLTVQRELFSVRARTTSLLRKGTEVQLLGVAALPILAAIGRVTLTRVHGRGGGANSFGRSSRAVAHNNESHQSALSKGEKRHSS